MSPSSLPPQCLVTNSLLSTCPVVSFMNSDVILCAFLHIILVSIYLIILVLARAGIFNKPLYFSEDMARTLVTMITQAFTIVRTISQPAVQ